MLVAEREDLKEVALFNSALGSWISKDRGNLKANVRRFERASAVVPANEITAAREAFGLTTQIRALLSPVASIMHKDLRVQGQQAADPRAICVMEVRTSTGDLATKLASIMRGRTKRQVSTPGAIGIRVQIECVRALLVEHMGEQGRL